MNAEVAKHSNFISPEQDALATDWKADVLHHGGFTQGRVFLNPPYGRGVVSEVYGEGGRGTSSR